MMAGYWPVAHWFVLSALLGPVGYVLQDVVADAMTVEAVPKLQPNGQPFSDLERKSMHTTMQTLGRVAIVGGSLAVALLNVWVFAGTGSMTAEQKTITYSSVYMWALVIPLISVLGVSLHWLLQYRRPKADGLEDDDSASQLTEPNWFIWAAVWCLCCFRLLWVCPSGAGRKSSFLWGLWQSSCF
jgi:NADH:ubiquinone oxidoreductase subunit 3 (subunit A)